MEGKKSCFTLALYCVIGLIALGIAIAIITWVIKATLTLISILVSIAVVVLIGYLAYMLLKALIKHTD